MASCSCPAPPASAGASPSWLSSPLNSSSPEPPSVSPVSKVIDGSGAGMSGAGVAASVVPPPALALAALMTSAGAPLLRRHSTSVASKEGAFLIVSTTMFAGMFRLTMFMTSTQESANALLGMPSTPATTTP